MVACEKSMTGCFARVMRCATCRAPAYRLASHVSSLCFCRFCIVLFKDSWALLGGPLLAKRRLSVLCRFVRYFFVIFGWDKVLQNENHLLKPHLPACESALAAFALACSHRHCAMCLDVFGCGILRCTPMSRAATASGFQFMVSA